MAKKLIRGSVIGAVLGIASGIVLSYVIFFVKYLNGSDGTYVSEIDGSPYVNVMSTDTAEDTLLRFHVRANSNSLNNISLSPDESSISTVTDFAIIGSMLTSRAKE